MQLESRHVGDVESALEGVQVAPYERGGGLPWFLVATDERLQTDFDSARRWFADARPVIDAVIGDVGAVVLRGFALSNAESFDRMIADYPPLAYSAGASARRRLAGNVYEATYLPADKMIDLHNEMSYLPVYPSKVAFFCAKPAERGGETIIGRTRDFEATIPESFREQVREKGVLYVRNMRSASASTGDAELDAVHKQWQESFETSDPQEVEDKCARMGMEWSWNDDASLSLRCRLDGFITAPGTGESLSFNQIHAQSFTPAQVGERFYERYEQFYGSSSMQKPYDVCFGDGTAMDPSIVNALTEPLHDITIAFPWERGDLMLLDNVLTMHGRNPFDGTRDVQAALIR